uniref:HD domain-containing protein n=1 Tax=Gracilinema caldarium TaxID=215591 RepID=A0A7C3EBX4_9SPIR
MMKSPFRELLEAGWTAELIGFSALDRYVHIPAGPVTYIQTTADLPELSKLFDNLRYPGVALADAAVDRDEGRYYFYCTEESTEAVFFHPLLSLRFNINRQVYIDERDLYPVYAEIAKQLLFPDSIANQEIPWLSLSESDSSPQYLLETAIILARYSPQETDYNREDPVASILKIVSPVLDTVDVPIEQQRTYLELLLTSNRPDLGFSFLLKSGIIAQLWPELAMMDTIDHSKEFHPEGNVWKHTLETFRHRKKPDLLLSLGLLLHDVGKSFASSSGNRRFDKHAELGEEVAYQFLNRLGFPPDTISKVQYLVRNHMMPAALPRLPLQRTQATIESPLFPLLLELYRCDEASSFKGLDNYYESAAAYQNYLKNTKNPYRSADGKKLDRKRRSF